MKTKLLVALIAALMLTGAILYNETLTPSPLAPEEKTAETGKFAPFPDIAFRTPDGKEFRIKDIKEPTVLVHFWAAWCAPCLTEFPELLKYVTNAHGKIALVAVSLDSRYEDSQKFLDKIGATDVPHVYWAWDKDKSLSLHQFNTVKVPETIVVNRGRLMVDKIIGAGPWAEASTGK